MHIFVFVFAVFLIAAAGVSQPGHAAPADKRGSLFAHGPKIGLSKEEIEQARQATGLVVCPATRTRTGVKGSGALVLSNQIIVTAAHLFFDKQDRRRELSECYFELQSDPHVRVKLDTKAIVFGITSRHGYSYFLDDWAVVRLVSPIQRAKPYRPFPLPREGNPLPEGTRLISVAAMAKDFKNNPKMPIVQECKVTKTRFNVRAVLSDCTSSSGMSGSVFLTRKDGELFAAGIITGSGKRPAAQTPGNASDDQSSVHTTLQQEFLRALTGMARCGKAACE
jgi:hypothetical protein